jgi:hypothetical protein
MHSQTELPIKFSCVGLPLVWATGVNVFSTGVMAGEKNTCTRYLEQTIGVRRPRRVYIDSPLEMIMLMMFVLCRDVYKKLKTQLHVHSILTFCLWEPSYQAGKSCCFMDCNCTLYRS